MRVRRTILGSLMIFSLLFLSLAFAENLPASAPTAAQTDTAAADPLLQMLVAKGVLTAPEAKSLVGTPAEQRAKLLEMLRQKGILSASDYDTLTTPSASAEVPSNLVASTSPIIPAGLAQAAPAPAPAPPPAGPTVVAAVAPTRVVVQDPPKKDGLNAAFKMGPVKMTPYGFIKTSVVHDSSAPDGDDFPFIGLFLNANPSSILSTGPTKDPEFHIKARSTRIGANLEWPDVSSRLTFTGRIEGDFEGMFSTVDNRDISSIRNPSFQMRLAWVRMDYAASDQTDIFFQAGQDWSIYGSTALPNIFETTFLGAFYGSSYTRSPQFTFGAVQKLGSTGVKLLPTFALMMPSSGQIEKLCNTYAIGGNATCLSGYENQLGQGEREGADADRPEYEARLAVQWQLDKAPAVAPAQIFWSGFHSRRTSIVPTSSYLCDGGTQLSSLPCSLEAAFPNGFQASSKQYGNQIGIQLPTRWFTLVASGYRGGDLRFFTGGQVSAFVTDVTGLSGVTAYTPSDGVVNASGPAALACNVPLIVGPDEAEVCPSTTNVVVAPQKPVRAFGGFINVGFPLSRWFNADPKGHNAGWQFFLHVGKDQVVDRDLNNVNLVGSLPLSMGKMFAGTLYYKINPWVTFGLEQSIYATRIKDGLPLYNIAGIPSNEWQDHRTEFGPIFTF